MIRLLFSFNGRIDRGRFWLGFVGVALTLYAVGVAVRLGFIPWEAGLILTIPLNVPFYALAAKRYHDLDMSGWYSTIFLFPIVGWFYVLFECGFLKGGAMKNRFGKPLHGPLSDREAS